MENLFGPIIYSYTRAEAISDGTLVDLSLHYPDQCRAYRYPVSCTAAVWALVEQGAAAGTGTTAGIVWDIIFMSLHDVVSRPDDCTVIFDVLIAGPKRTKTHRLKALCHPGDHMEPVITVMLHDED